MTETEIAKRKLEIIQLILDCNDKNFLLQCERVLIENIDSPERISIEQYNKEIDEAEADIEAGNYYTIDEARKIASQWGK